MAALSFHPVCLASWPEPTLPEGVFCRPKLKGLGAGIRYIALDGRVGIRSTEPPSTLHCPWIACSGCMLEPVFCTCCALSSPSCFFCWLLLSAGAPSCQYVFLTLLFACFFSSGATFLTNLIQMNASIL